MRKIISIEKEIAFKTMIGEITSIALEQELAFINDNEIEGNLIISGTYKMTEASAIEEEFSYKIPVEIMLTTSLEETKRNVAINNFTYKVVNEEALELNIELLIEGLEKIEIPGEEESDEIEIISEEKLVKEERTIELEPFKEEKEEKKKETEERNMESDTIREDFDDEEEEIEVLESSNQTQDSLLNSLDINLGGDEKVLKDNTNTTTKEKKDNNEVMDSIFSAFANTKETYATYSIYILRENDNLDDVIQKYKTTREALHEYNDLDNLKVGSKLIIPTSVETDE